MIMRTILFLLFSLQITTAQVITWIPNFPTQNDSIFVYFDATQGNGGLAGYTGDVYAHTGVITNLSTNPADWRYVKTNWGQNTPETKLERIGPDLYLFKIRPSVRSFYGVPVSENILEVAFVFRSGVQVGGQYLEGKTETGGDIFLPLFGAGLNVAITQPAQYPVFPAMNDTVRITAISSHSVNLALYVNDVLVAQTTDSTLNHNIIVTESGKKRVKAVATGYNSQTTADSIYYVVNPPVTIAPVPAGIVDGINYTSNTSMTLSLYAPEKDFVYVIGDFTNWEVEPGYFMTQTPDGKRWWAEVNGLTPQQEYIFQYLVNGTMRIADPYSEKISDPWHDKNISASTYPNLIQYPVGKTTQIASVIQTGQQPFNWQVTNFERPAPADLVIYELLIRDFLSTHDYKTLKDTLSYLKSLGVNAIELMPVMEFSGNESWGYNPTFHLAPDKYYGPKDDLKKFIDAAHAEGMAVILDIVLNHIDNPSPLARLYWDAQNNRPSINNPWLNPLPRHPFNVFNDFNHESDATKYYVDRVNLWWLQEYNADGYRFDLSKGFTQTYSGSNVGLWNQYDQSRINLLKRMADVIWAYDSTAYIILEHFADNNEEVVLSNYGMMLWGNMNHDYAEASMGYNSNLSWGSYKSRGWNDPHLITYAESHDEERIMYKNLQWGNSSGSYNIKHLNIALQRIKLIASFLFTIPGPKMFWQFGELGYDVSIDYPCRVCNKPILWNYLNDARRKNVYKVFAALIKLKEYDAFRSTDFNLNVGTYSKRININHSSMNVSVVGNFNVLPMNNNPNFSNTGWWYEYFTGDSIFVTDTQAPFMLEPGEFRIYTTVRLPKPEDGILSNVESFDAGIVEDFYLEQNYPNPFNPSTDIIYMVKEPSLVSIKVYDMLGREVKTLVNETKSAGSYVTSWSGDNNYGQPVSSGVYFYRMDAGGYNAARKMIFMK